MTSSMAMKPCTRFVIAVQEAKMQKGRQEGRHEEQGQTDAVEPQAIVDGGDLDPGDMIGKLHVRGPGIEIHHSGRPIARSAMVTPSAIQRACCAPTHNSAAAPASGRNMTSVTQGNVVASLMELCSEGKRKK